MFLLGMVALYTLLTSRFKKTRAEAVMVCMIMCFACLFTLTLTGIWLRGPGMLLVWP